MKCLRCEHTWEKRKSHPRRCPRCKSLHWRSCKQPLTQIRVRDLFDYDPGGYLIWKLDTHPTAIIGEQAGTKRGNGYGYHRVGVDGSSYRLHRVIFLWHHGWMPDLIDHIDGNPENSKVENLRAGTRGLNSINSGVRRDNTSGVKGVGYYAGRWVAYLTSNGVRKHLGCFLTKEQAVMARLREEARLGWDTIMIANLKIKSLKNDTKNN